MSLVSICKYVDDRIYTKTGSVWKLFCLHQNGVTFIQACLLVEIFIIWKDQKWQNLCANIVHCKTSNILVKKCQISYVFSLNHRVIAEAIWKYFCQSLKKIPLALLGCFSMSDKESVSQAVYYFKAIKTSIFLTLPFLAFLMKWIKISKLFQNSTPYRPTDWG